MVLAPEMVSGDSDLVVHILYGRALLENGWLSSDPLLSGITGAPILQEWLFEVLVAWLDSRVGLTGILLLAAALTGFLVSGIYRGMRNRGVCLWLALVYALVLLFTLRTHLIIRPHLLSWVGTALLMVLLYRWEQIEQQRRDLAAAAILFLLWANLHGGFLLGLAIIAVYLASALLSRLKPGRVGVPGRWFLLLSVAALVTLINPWGWHLHLHLYQFLTDRFLIGGTSDFQPPSFSKGTLPALLVALPLVWLPLLARFRQVSTAHWLLAAGLTVAAIQSGRNIPLLGIVILPLAAVYAQQWLARSEASGTVALIASSRRMEHDDERGYGLVLPVTVLAVSLALIASGLYRTGLRGEQVPQAALAWVRSESTLHSQPVFADFLAAGFLLYDTPVERVYLHSLNANYPAERLITWIRAGAQEPGWEQDLAGLPWAFLLTDTAQAHALNQSDCFAALYSDKQATVFENRCGGF